MFLGFAALFGRPLGYLGLLVTFVVGIFGAVWPLPRILGRSTQPLLSRKAAWLWALGIGVGAFGVARLLTGVGAPAEPVRWYPMVANVLAAVAEEAFFRRFVFGYLERWGVPVAVLGSSVAFALVHVPAYGVDVVGINLAAGLIFGWQRWLTGGWAAPALTHCAANLFQTL